MFSPQEFRKIKEILFCKSIIEKVKLKFPIMNGGIGKLDKCNRQLKRILKIQLIEFSFKCTLILIFFFVTRA